MQSERGMVECNGRDGHYILGQAIVQEEDLLHEFKGHRSISIHDIHNMCLQSGGAPERTRNAVSISIGAMLNSGYGGIIYLGVTDNGQVRGLTLTRYQMDHIEASLEWTLGRFTPPVPDSRYRVDFVPVVSNKTQRLSHDIEEHVDSKRRSRPHHVAQPNYCWCDIDAAAQQALGKLPILYVVEIHVRPWEPHSLQGRNLGISQTPALPPLHLNEASSCFFRQSCRQPRLCLEDVRRLLVHRVQEHYTLKLAALEHRYEALQHLARQHNVTFATDMHPSDVDDVQVKK
ncbi:schlafen-like protein 2 isoform X2 [Procambarus clarkii]|uniref:schlafen-like protein 2 isoform X1 n=2 Tax=Procambarus clarkii TaxID=6728 RepID=UPI0037425E73